MNNTANKKDRLDKALEAQMIMDKPEFIRNIGIAAHIDHGKTTLSDNLIAGAGMMSEELAGKQLLLDFDEQEQARGITINAANASHVLSYDSVDVSPRLGRSQSFPANSEFSCPACLIATPRALKIVVPRSYVVLT